MNVQAKYLGADTLTTKDGSRSYLKVKFSTNKEINGATLKLTINVNDSDSNIDRVVKMEQSAYTADFNIDETKIHTGNFEGKPFAAFALGKQDGIKMGFSYPSTAERLKAKRVEDKNSLTGLID